MRMILVAAFLVAIATVACGPSATTPESDFGASPQQPKDSSPALLLSEESAISILQTFLQDCLHGWEDAYAGQMKFEQSDAIIWANRQNGSVRRTEELNRILGTVFPTATPWPTPTPLPPDLLHLPTSEQEKKSWFIDLATGTIGDIAWSASYHGVTEVPPTSSLRSGTKTKDETWVVIGPGLERAESQLATPGRWKVYAGHRRAYHLDSAARLALEEYDSYNSCP